ncbi:hypothetical protein [Chitinophaga sp.]|uniref:hypothetical protein n=1 Tax=Chitinophaga sp. TaxID=1869181 RepID=UPI0031D578A0
MDTLLVDGRYTAAEAETLLSRLLKVKIDFHLARIDTVNSSEENIKHSEKRIKELESEHRRINQLLKNGSYKHVALRASLTLEFCPDYQNA